MEEPGGGPNLRAGLTLRAPPASSSQAQAGGPASPQRPPRPGVQLLAQFAGCRWVAVWRCTGHRLTCGVSRASSPLLGGAVGWLVRSLSPPPRPSPAFPSGSSPVSSPSPGLAPSPPARGPLSFTSILVTIPLLSPSASPPLSCPASAQVGLSCLWSARRFCQLACLLEARPRRPSSSAPEALVQSAPAARGLSARGFPTGGPPPPPPQDCSWPRSGRGSPLCPF